MAFNSILHSKSSTFVRAFSSATQLIRKTQPGHRALLSVAVNRYKGSFVPKFHFSSVAVQNEPNSDETLLRLIESKITCAQETDEFRAGEEVPSNFPFKIFDDLGQCIITLKRTYQGEEIQVEVSTLDLDTREEHDNHQKDDKDNESERETQSSIPLSVSVSKKDGTSLEFDCVAYPDEMVICSLFITNRDEDIRYYDRLDFQDLDEALQKSFHKYLEIRGIKPSTANFLHEYMINRKIRKYSVGLNKLKNFIKA